MKLKQLVESRQALENLLKVEFDVMKAYDLVTFIRETNKHLENFDKTREKRIRELGEETDGIARVKEENVPLFFEEMAKLLDTEVEVVPPDFKVADFSGAKITPNDMAVLADWLIKKE